MRTRPSITPYMSSADESINASISFAKLHGRLRRINPGYTPSSRYQMRLQSNRAARRIKLRTKR